MNPTLHQKYLKLRQYFITFEAYFYRFSKNLDIGYFCKYSFNYDKILHHTFSGSLEDTFSTCIQIQSIIHKKKQKVFSPTNNKQGSLFYFVTY